jgi:hypothetical protein
VPRNRANPIRIAEGNDITVHQMIEQHPQPTSLARDVLLRCIDACVDCASSCTSCADAGLAEDDVQELIRCIRLNLDCADLCDATARIVIRQTAADAGVARTAAEACAAACRACGDECERHAAHHEHYRICAAGCRRCEQSCRDLVAAIG